MAAVTPLLDDDDAPDFAVAADVEASRTEGAVGVISAARSPLAPRTRLA